MTRTLIQGLTWARPLPFSFFKISPPEASARASARARGDAAKPRRNPSRSPAAHLTTPCKPRQSLPKVLNANLN